MDIKKNHTEFVDLHTFHWLKTFRWPLFVDSGLTLKSHNLFRLHPKLFCSVCVLQIGLLAFFAAIGRDSSLFFKLNDELRQVKLHSLKTGCILFGC